MLKRMVDGFRKRQLRRIAYEVYTYREAHHIYGLAELDIELATEYLKHHRRKNLFTWLEEKIGYGTGQYKT